MRRCGGTSEERSGLNQPTTPPGFRIFRPNPAFVAFFEFNFTIRGGGLHVCPLLESSSLSVLIELSSLVVVGVVEVVEAGRAKLGSSHPKYAVCA